MPRPKGHKTAHGYAVLSDIETGVGYKQIAEEMTCRGYKMNLSTARNVLISAMDKIAVSLCQDLGVTVTKDSLKRIACDPRFQSGVYDMLSEKFCEQDK